MSYPQRIQDQTHLAQVLGLFCSYKIQRMTEYYFWMTKMSKRPLRVGRWLRFHMVDCSKVDDDKTENDHFFLYMQRFCASINFVKCNYIFGRNKVNPLSLTFYLFIHPSSSARRILIVSWKGLANKYACRDPWTGG